MTQAPTPGPLTAAIDMLSEARDFIDRFSDVREGDYGTSEPNAAMVMVHEINATIDQISAPTAPVEASGSERDRIAKVLRERVQIGGTDWDKSAYGADMNAEEVADAILSTRPLALGGQQGEAVAWIDPSDLEHVAEGHPLTTTLFPYAKDGATVPLYTTPARAEALDEGAAGGPWGWVIGNRRDGKKWFSQDHTAVEAWLADPDFFDVTPVYRAHPSPTPAADDDKLRIAVEALEETKNRVREWPIDDQETCMCGSPVASHGMGDGHSPVSQGDHAISMIVEAINEALAALKSTAAKEGGKG